ncbi:DMT family transporter [Streptomyces collinus]|uniref:DMT family transporter n=1 Tax=Streptomyces collinus TaxID=42684 RepID=UPI0036E5C4C2
MSALALSVLLSFVSAVAYAGGAIVQEQVALSSPGGSYLPLRRAGWWAALGLNGLGGVLHVVALAYGPLSLVQPLGALTIVFALPMAALCVGRRAGATAWRGAVMATVGLAGLLSVVGSAGTHSLDPAQRVAVALVTGGAVAALTVAGLAAHRHPAVRSVLLATASGIAFGMSSVFTKTVAVDWDAGIGLGDLPALAVIGVFATAGVLLSQASYRGGGLAAPLATLTVVNPVLAAAVGILMFGETFRYGTTGTLLALGCGVVACGGLILLTTERLEPEREPVPGPEAVTALDPVPRPEGVPALAPSPGPEAVTALAPAAEDETPVPGAGFAAREALAALPRQRPAATEPGRDSAVRVKIGDPGPDELAELTEIAGITWATEVVRMTEMARATGRPNATGEPDATVEPDVAGSPQAPAPGEPETPDMTEDTVPVTGAAAPALVFPPSYTPLSTTFYVPLPVLHRQRQRYARVRS